MRLALQYLRRSDELVDINDKQGRALYASSRYLFDRILNVESSDLTADETAAALPQLYEQLATRVSGRLILKTHDAWTLTAGGTPLMPASVTDGVVYLVRDPRDIAPSFAHHLGASVDVAIDAMANPRNMLAASHHLALRQLPERLLTWSGHVESWLDHSGVRLLLVRYEDMVADMPSVLSRVARFIGVEANDAAINRAVESVHFSKLQAREARQGFTDGPQTNTRFFRRGIVGSWRDEMTDAQVERIGAVHGRMMRRLGYEIRHGELPE